MASITPRLGAPIRTDMGAITSAAERFARDLVALVEKAIVSEIRERGGGPRARRFPPRPNAGAWPWPGTLTHRVLAALRQHPNGLRNSELAQRIGAAPNRVAKCVGRLVLHGLVIRRDGATATYVAVAE